MPLADFRKIFQEISKNLCCYGHNPDDKKMGKAYEPTHQGTCVFIAAKGQVRMKD
jgi:hypothetical protein